jgi:DNA-binding HxlR family transcriptional regulator
VQDGSSRIESVSEAAAPYAPPTGLEAALDRVGDRWSLLVVDALLDGPRRFGELEKPSRGSPPTS